MGKRTLDDLVKNRNHIPEFFRPFMYRPRPDTDLEEVLIAQDKEEEFECMALLLGYTIHLNKHMVLYKDGNGLSYGYRGEPYGYTTVAKRTAKSGMWLVRWRMFKKHVSN